MTSRACSLCASVRPEVHLVEHERAECDHRSADLLSLADVAGGL